MRTFIDILNRKMQRQAARALPALGLLMLALILVGCGAGASPEMVTREMPVSGGGSFTDVNVAGMRQMLDAKDFLFVNVHIPYEGEIEQTDLFIPYDDIEAHLDQLPGNQDAKIVLYCMSDRMSRIAARELVGRGYTDVWNLDGGMVAWRAAGHAVLQR